MRTAAEPADPPSRIVIGYDGSESARRALRRVAALAAPGAQVVAVVAAIAPYPGSGVTIPVNEKPAEVHRRRQDLDEARALLAGYGGLDASTRLLDGEPADALIDAAKDADLAVVGTRSFVGCTASCSAR